MSIPVRQLGRGGPKVPAMGFGISSLSYAYGVVPDDAERFKILDRAVELGDTFWDTSDSYGDNEKLIGQWFKRSGKRNQIFLASKFGLAKAPQNPQNPVDSSAAYCREALEDSLKKLGVDYLDLYYAHRVNPDVPIEETVRAMAELKAEGKIKHIGLSEVSSATLRRAHKVAPISAVQMEYSPFVLDIEGERGTDILQTCHELGVAIICYSPLGRGLLTGTMVNADSVKGPNDIRSVRFPWFQEENIDANLKLVNEFKRLADKKGCSPSQLALTWILKQDEIFIPIPSTKKMKYLEENWSALNLTLTDEEAAEIRRFAEAIEVSGGRTGLAGAKYSYTDTVEEAANKL